MLPAFLLLLAGGARAQIAPVNAPSFTAAGIVQGATQLAGPLAPNTIATIYGTNLSWTAEAASETGLTGGLLPTSLAGVSVYVNDTLANLLYVSPGQINFLIPYSADGSSAGVVVARQGVGGPVDANGQPTVVIPLAPVAPGFFQWNGNFAVAEHADGSLITPMSPAQAGETVVLYGAGLGLTNPATVSGALPTSAAIALCAAKMRILLNGAALPPGSIYYAGLTPGFAGLYQINLALPVPLPANPQIQIAVGDAISPPGILLYAN